MFDVLLPFYGDPSLLKQAVNSVLSQDCEHYRLIVLDDCYPDPAARAWLESLRDTRVEYHRNNVNLGARLNYIKALQLASADYVVFMGADDRMLSGFLSRAARLIAEYDEPAVLQSGVRIIDGNGDVHLPMADRVKSWCRPRVDGSTVLTGPSAVTSLLRGNWAYFPSLVWRRATISTLGFREFNVVQDLGLLVDVVRSGGRLVLDDSVTFEYRRHSASDSAVKTGTGIRFGEERAYFQDIGRDLRAQGWDRAARAASIHLTSRLHAASRLPDLAAARAWRPMADAVAHTFA